MCVYHVKQSLITVPQVTRLFWSTFDVEPCLVTINEEKKENPNVNVLTNGYSKYSKNVGMIKTKRRGLIRTHTKFLLHLVYTFFPYLSVGENLDLALTVSTLFCYYATTLYQTWLCAR